MDPIRTLFDREAHDARGVLPPALLEHYGGDLSFPSPSADRPYVIANFVSTLDGVVSFDIPGESGGGQISGSNEDDRFIMGMLRASADAILVGAGTVNAVPRRALWLPGSIYPPAEEEFGRYRRETLNKREPPLVAVVSGAGNLDLNRALFQSGAMRIVIFTGAEGRERLLREGAGRLPSTDIRELTAAVAGKIDPRAILNQLKEREGVRLLLHEGGPTLLGGFVATGIVDELFLTLAPQIAGRVAGHPRPALLENAEFLPETAPWLSLISAKQHGSHLYLRYEISRRPGPSSILVRPGPFTS